MSGIPVQADVRLGATTQHTTTTVDSNIFPPETNKVATIGRLRPKKYLFQCDGKGHMRLRYLDDPIKTLERLAKQRDRGIISEDDFQQAKARLLDQL